MDTLSTTNLLKFVIWLCIGEKLSATRTTTNRETMEQALSHRFFNTFSVEFHTVIPREECGAAIVRCNGQGG